MHIRDNKSISILGDIARVLCAVVLAAILVTGVAVYGISLPRMLLMAAFVIIYVMLPGAFVLERTGISFDHISVSLMMSIFTGWSFEILVYFVNDAVPTDFLLYAAGPVLSALYIYGLVRDKRNPVRDSGFSFRKLPVSLCIFITLVMLYCALHVQFRYLSPELSDFITMNPDKAYHLGLINSLSHDYPIISPWVDGVVIHYHVFSEILFSIPVRLFGIPSDLIMLSFGPFWTTCVFGLSVYAFFREMAGAKERAGIYSLLLLLSNLYITRNIHTSIAFVFALENDNSSGYGIAAVFAIIIMFRKWYGYFTEKDPKRWPALVLLTAYVMLATGIKGPMGAVMAGAMWGTMILGMILRKVSPKALAPVAAVTAGFLLVYMTVLSGKGTSNTSGESIFAFGKLTNIAFWKKPLIEAMKSAGIPGNVRLAIILLVFVIFFLTIFFVPFCIGYVRELALVLTGRKDFEPARVLVYASAFVGFTLMMILNYSGHSQIYFGLVAAFLAPLIAFWFIEDMEAARDTSKAAMHTLRITVSIMSLCLILTTVSLADDLSRNFEGAVRDSDPHRKGGKYKSISQEEYDAMVWLNDNTEEDALLANDRYYSVPPDEYDVDDRWDNRFFLYEVYSNRFSYISGSGYSISDKNSGLRRDMIEKSEQLYDPSNEKRGDLARELGVDYVVVSKRFTDVGDLSNKDYELYYENDDITVYKIAG